MHPDQIPATPKAHRGEGLGGGKKRPTREKMGRTPDTRWGKVYSSSGSEINPVEIQKFVDERTAITASVKPGKLVVVSLGDHKVTVDARHSQIQVISEDTTFITPSLKSARAEARLMLRHAK